MQPILAIPGDREPIGTDWAREVKWARRPRARRGHRGAVRFWSSNENDSSDLIGEGDH